MEAQLAGGDRPGAAPVAAPLPVSPPQASHVDDIPAARISITEAEFVKKIEREAIEAFVQKHYRDLNHLRVVILKEYDQYGFSQAGTKVPPTKKTDWERMKKVCCRIQCEAL